MDFNVGIKNLPGLQVEGGGEIVIYGDKYVVEQTYPGASYIVAAYIYGGPNGSADPVTGGSIASRIFSDETVARAIMDISNGTGTSPISGSASVFAILGNESFNSPGSYTEWFTSYSATLKHIRGYYSISSKAKSVGVGYSTSLFSADVSQTYYVLVSEAPFGIPSDGFFDELEGVFG